MKTHKGSCHCGAVQFEAEIDLKKGAACNCSICQKKGTILTFVPEPHFKLLSGADLLTDYQFGKKKLHHTFCSVCGITAFAYGIAPTGQKTHAVNVRCLDDVDLKAIEIIDFDGRSL